MREHVSLEELFRLVPALDELEGLRASIMTAALPDPEKEWASSSAYATVDKRVISRDAAEEALLAAEQALRQQVESLFASLRTLFDHHWSGDGVASANALIALGDEEEARGRPVRALAIHRTALQLSLPLADKRPQILALRRIGRVLWHTGDLIEARQYYARSAELADAAGEFRSEVIARTGIGNVLLFQGRWADAEVSYRAALELLDGSNAPEMRLERGQLYNNLGGALMRQNRLPEAEEWLSRAADLWQQVESPTDVGVWHHSVGLLRYREGDLTAARDAMERGVRLPIPSALRSVIATDLAEVCRASGLMSQASAWSREAETHAIASGSPYHMSHMYTGLGDLACARGDEGGITFFEKALEIAIASHHAHAEAEALIGYALLRAKIGDPEEALSYAERAREIFTDLGAEHERERAQRVLDEIRPARPLAAAGD